MEAKLSKIEQANAAMLEEKTNIQAGVQALIQGGDPATQSIDDALEERFQARHTLIKSVGAEIAPNIAKKERQELMKKEELAADELVELILKMVEKLLENMGFNVELTGENVSARHVAIAECEVSKQLENIESMENKGQDLKIEKAEEKEEENEIKQIEKREITPADVLRGGSEEYDAFKEQESGKKEQEQAQNQGQNRARAR